MSYPILRINTAEQNFGHGDEIPTMTVPMTPKDNLQSPSGSGPTPFEPGKAMPLDRVADYLAIQNLAIAYAFAVDDRDWPRWQEIFEPDANVDYIGAGGIAGTPAEIAAWFPDAMSIFKRCMHSILTHEIEFTGPETAKGRVHVFNRNVLDWEGEREVLDVSGFYVDKYKLRDGTWRISERVEEPQFLEGGAFAKVLRDTTGMD